MNPEIVEFVKRLGVSIPEALESSEKHAKVVHDIKAAGYSLVFNVEATFSIKNNLDLTLDLTDDDEAFLRALNITVEE